MRPAITLSQVTKSFSIHHRPAETLQEALLYPWRPKKTDTLHALQDISLDVAPGEWLGVIGPNGSGKSTLLKLIAGIYQPTRGTVAVDGQVAPLLELGVGFHPNLTARENVTLNCLLLGLTRSDVKQSYDSIVSFAELKDFMDMPLKYFSTGMRLRLAFAITLHIDRPIMLLDEVLAVGDLAFREKCLAVLQDLRHSGKTVLFASHQLKQVRTLCDRVLYLEGGQVQHLGPADETIKRYVAAS